MPPLNQSHAACRRRRGARYLLKMAIRLRNKQACRSDNAQFKVPHKDVTEFLRLCAELATLIEQKAFEFRARK